NCPAAPITANFMVPPGCGWSPATVHTRIETTRRALPEIRRMPRRMLILGLFVAVLTMPVWAGESAADRGRKALLEKTYNPAVWTPDAFANVWKRWPGVTEKPADYDRAVRDYYGLHPAPYPNAGLPMGLREGWRLLAKGISVDCMICHGGSILGQSYVGLGNTSLDIEALFADLNGA